jgi:outer membrane protein
MPRNTALPVAIIALIVAIATFFIPQSTSELVYVDVNKLLEGYDRTKAERDAFEKKATIMKANIDSLLTEWQNELMNYEKERSKMAKKELELKQQQLQYRQQQINNYQEAVQKQIREEEQKMAQTLLNDINDYVSEFGKKSGHRIIFGAQGSGNIMYAEEGVDLTEEILIGINKQ